MSKRETIRRLLWGDLLKVLRVRYGNPPPCPMMIRARMTSI